MFLCFYTYRCRCLRARPHRWYLSVRYRDSRMLGQSASVIWRTCKYFLTVKTGRMDPTNIIMFLLFFCVTGAIAVDPQAQKNQWNVLTGVTMWNGKPQHEFRINWFHLLCGALGAIVQEGWTLLQTARNQDLGSPGNPGTPQDARKSTNRNVRLYHCIANYIDKSCSIYRDAQLLFPDDGRALFNYIWHKGERAFTARQQIRREAKWNDASISALAIPIDEDTPITWKEWCFTEGRKPSCD